MAIRGFKLANSSGVIWDLNDLNSFFVNAENLGHERDFDFESVGNYNVEVSSEIKQANPKGTIYFKDYATCNNFIKFIQYTPLTLTYEMPGVSDGYLLQVKIQKFNKKEIEKGMLPCDVSFVGIGQYYRIISAENLESSDVGKIYPYTYPYVYTDNRSGEVTINSDTILNSPTKITIFGPCENPVWTHYVNNIVETTGKVNCTVNSGERLVVDSTVIPYSIKKYDAYMNLLDDCYPDSDFSTGRFINLKFGENKIAFTHSGSEDLSVSVEGRIMYESV